MDLSSLSDAELEAIISGGAPATAAPTTAAPTAAAPTAPAPRLEPSWGNTIAGTVASAGQGIFGGFLDEMAAGVTAPLDVLGGLLSGDNISLSDAYTRNLTQNRAGLAAFKEQAPVVATGLEVGGAIVSPINKIGMGVKAAGALPSLAQLMKAGAIQGGIYGAGSAEGNDAIASEALKGAAFGGGASGVVGALGKGASWGGQQLQNWGRGSKNRLYGLTANDIKKSLTRDATGSAKDGVSRIEQALDDLIDTKSIKAGSATDNVIALQSQLGDLSTQTKQIFKQVDSVQQNVVTPKWKATTDYINNKLADADKAKAVRLFNKYKNGVENNSVLLSDLEHQKSIFQKMGKDALGPEGKDTLNANIFKNMGLDLKNAVDDELANPLYQQVLGKSAVGQVKDFRKGMADRLKLLPSLRQGEAREAVSSFNDFLINTFKTTGGFGVPALVGGLTAGPAGAITGLAAGATLRSTPAQQSLIALLKGGGAGLGATGAGLQGAALPASRALAAMFTGNETTPEQALAAPSEMDFSRFSDEELEAMITAPPSADTALPTAEVEGFERTSFVPEGMPEMTLTSDSGIDFIKQHEGLRLTAYDDGTGKRTIGYGHTADVPEKITKEEAEAKLIADIEKHEDAVKDLVKVPLTQEQFDALSSFTFNLGAGALNRSTLLKKLNAGDYQGAADEFLKWDKARIKGKLNPMRGLTKRRQAERELFLKGLEKDLITI